VKHIVDHRENTEEHTHGNVHEFNGKVGHAAQRRIAQRNDTAPVIPITDHRVQCTKTGQVQGNTQNMQSVAAIKQQCAPAVVKGSKGTPGGDMDY